MNSGILNSLIRVSPAVLLVSMCLSFIVMGGLQIFFYADVFAAKMDSGFVFAIAIAIALILQGSRFAFGLAAVNESYRGKYFHMIFGLLFSLGLTIVETYEVAEIAHQWDLGSYAQSVTIILFAVLWVGFCLELRLILNLAGKGVNIDVVINEETNQQKADKLLFGSSEQREPHYDPETIKFYLKNKNIDEDIPTFFKRFNNQSNVELPTRKSASFNGYEPANMGNG